MLTIGGLSPLDSGTDTMSQDHETNGLGLWDLTDLRWIDAYDADAAPYKTPNIVKDWYKEKYVANISNLDEVGTDTRAAGPHPSSGTTPR